MKISQPKSIFSTRRNQKNPQNQHQSSSSSTRSRESFIQKTKSFVINNTTTNKRSTKEKSSITPTTTSRSANLDKSKLSFQVKSSSTTKKQEQNIRDILNHSSSNSKSKYKQNENQARKQEEAAISATSSTSEVKQNEHQSLNDGLAICLFGYSVQAQTHKIEDNISSATNLSKGNNLPGISETKPSIQTSNLFEEMYDTTLEEEIRQQAVMAEVLPDAEMWAKWEKTEAPLRQGRGWYPKLDRHFLELLVISEIHALSNPINGNSGGGGGGGNSDKIHRHANRVRRVACERIGSERLNAYCDRVKEAFEAYMMGGWSNQHLHHHHQEQFHQQSVIQQEHNEDDVDDDVDDDELKHLELSSEEDVEEDDHNIGSDLFSSSKNENDSVPEERGRNLQKGKGSIKREHTSSRNNSKTRNNDDAEERESVELQVPEINIIPSEEKQKNMSDNELMQSNLDSNLELSDIPLSDLKERSNEGSDSNSNSIFTQRSKGMDIDTDSDNDNDHTENNETSYSNIINKNGFFNSEKMIES
ncbi:uncharacterized protein L201_005650 [Kwoniella dendrophila CBS 6074]|uniref:Uncharacterized protein n=1 Tax=Kwoniella dendrophila CBS 6074 TaxID=1295534 RepID=A0AAX4K0Q7_9TREE